MRLSYSHACGGLMLLMLAKCLLQIKDHNNVSGNNRENQEYFDEMDGILGTRPTSAPVALVHSGVGDMSQVPSSALNGKLLISV